MSPPPPFPGLLPGYFLGGFTPGHLWFIALLFVFSLLLLALFQYLRRAEFGKRLVGWLAAFLSLPGMIFVPAIPLYVMNRLIDFYPNPFYFITYFILGYILVADARFEKAIDRHKTVALILGPVLYLLVPYFDIYGWPNGIPSWLWPVIRLYIPCFAPWFFIVAILGYGRKFLNFRNKFLTYNAQASYPLYILHQTAIVIIGVYVTRWQVSVSVKYVSILVLSLISSVLIYDLVIKRTNVTRFMFGMKLKKKSAKVSAPHSKEAVA